MITREQIKETLNKNKCFYCYKNIDYDTPVYYIWANNKGQLSIKVPFHMECWRQIAGDDYIFEEHVKENKNCTIDKISYYCKNCNNLLITISVEEMSNEESLTIDCSCGKINYFTIPKTTYNLKKGT